MDFQIPPLEDLARDEASEPDSGVDLDALMAKIVGGEPVVTKAEPNVYVGRVGRADAEELLRARSARFKAPAPNGAPDNSDIAKMVANIVTARVKALSPSTTTREATEAAPARATSPEAAEWEWEDLLGDGSGMLPRKQTEPASATYADGGDLAKRANRYTSMLLGGPDERRAARAAITTWKTISRGGSKWKVGHDADGVVVAEFETDEEGDD